MHFKDIQNVDKIKKHRDESPVVMEITEEGQTLNRVRNKERKRERESCKYKLLQRKGKKTKAKRKMEPRKIATFFSVSVALLVLLH